MKPHELDIISLIAGLIFLATGIGHLLGVNFFRMWTDLGGLLPVLLIVGGGLLLIRVLRHARDS